MIKKYIKLLSIVTLLMFPHGNVEAISKNITSKRGDTIALKTETDEKLLKDAKGPFMRAVLDAHGYDQDIKDRSSKYYDSFIERGKKDDSIEIVTALKEGKAIGLVIYEKDKGNKALWVRGVTVSPEYQRAGIGTALIEGIRADNPGYIEMRADARKNNPKAIGFYINLGFEKQDLPYNVDLSRDEYDGYRKKIEV